LPITDYEKLRFATPSSRPRYKRGQEADNDQKRTPQSLQTAYVNKSTGSHRSQPPTAQRTLSTDAALGLPLPRPNSCLTPALAPARLMSATSSQVYSAQHHCRCDVPVRIRSLPGCPGCRGMRRCAVVGGECPPLSKYCTSREAVFVCSGHHRAVGATIFGCA